MPAKKLSCLRPRFHIGPVYELPSDAGYIGRADGDQGPVCHTEITALYPLNVVQINQKAAVAAEKVPAVDGGLQVIQAAAGRDHAVWSMDL